MSMKFLKLGICANLLVAAALFAGPAKVFALKRAPVNNSANLQPIPPLQGTPNISGNVNYNENGSTSIDPHTQTDPEAPRPDQTNQQPEQLDSFQQEIYDNLQAQVASQKQRDADAEAAARAVSNLRWIAVFLQASLIGIIYILYKTRGKSLTK